MKTVNYAGHANLAEMILGHIPNWRMALETLRKCQLSEDDSSYIEHELRALQDIETAVNAELNK